ncbi:outer membrane lipid asymmetry maintenance protein MlaD [Tabrizicola piscis]|jgi:phospholipid/cholesterol/gamma-HCH transport system substrate-binding protein|uniref:Outer membrane lipid asymmetry maintenance protein MlaD n=1 Tax=Tabrizicola piscis TaxID=2494374 RepID=A0A3S8U1L8_9RHOB|nr:outer membrane lipid asymmetry maintenance protein MlaD [Tabrizicola piscis]AZL57493.1 outer membrane lipid asymmetry maintenance protein MlaD [Tabrizicola piscis]
MAYERAEVATGAAVLAVAIGFAVYAAQGSGVLGEAESYPLTASFRSIEGIGVGSDVRLAGVKVGTVTDLTLNPGTFFADAEISMRNDVQLPVDSTILVSSEGLLGGNFIEVLPGGALENLEPGAEIEDTQGAVSLINLLLKFVGGGDAAASDPAAP